MCLPLIPYSYAPPQVCLCGIAIHKRTDVSGDTHKLSGIPRISYLRCFFGNFGVTPNGKRRGLLPLALMRARSTASSQFCTSSSLIHMRDCTQAPLP